VGKGVALSVASNAVTFDFTGATVLVTGGSNGIGLGIATAFADAGAHVTITGTRTSPGEYDHDLSRFEFVQCSMADPDDLVIPSSTFRLDNWNATMNINLTGTLLCSQHAARLMRKRRWGRIISIASVAGMRAVGSGRTAYGTSKAAVIGLMRQIAAELTVEGITANAIAPGPVDTPLTQVLHSPAFRKAYTAAIPAGRYGLTTEIAAMAAFLASDQAAYVSGAAIPVDGGFYAAGARGV